MHKQEQQNYMNRFIGRNKEVETFIHWLTDADAPWILYIHDAADEADKKGGVGKTWLLRRYAEIAKQKFHDTAVVMADFFNIGDRDRFFLAEKILSALSDLYPDWQPDAFLEATNPIRRYEVLSSSRSDEASRIRGYAT